MKIVLAASKMKQNFLFFWIIIMVDAKSCLLLAERSSSSLAVVFSVLPIIRSQLPTIFYSNLH